MFAQNGNVEVLPTYYIYHGQRLNLALDPSSVAVRVQEGTTHAELVKWLGEQNVVAVDAIAIHGWYFLKFASRSQDALDVSERIHQILKLPSIEFASPVFHGIDDNWVVLTPDILMRFRAGNIKDADLVLQQVASELNVITRNFGNMEGALKLRSVSRNGFEALRSANNLAVDPRVDWSEPDAMFSGRGDYIPNDPGFANLWAIRNTGQVGGIPGMDMDGDLAWDVTTGSSSVKVLIIDVGVQQNHPDIHQLQGTDLTGEGGGGGPVNACDNHGTAVAGCVAATIDNNLGTVGIAPGCYVISARTFVSNLACDGSWSTNASWTVDALTWGELQGARVSNNSNGYGFTSSAIEAKYQSSYEGGMVHFASAGNNGNSVITYPASIPVVNAVAALDPDGTLTSFSCYGTGLDFSAPGISIYSTDRTGAAGYFAGDYGYVQGTSFASPYAAGVAALVISAFPYFTCAQVEARMQARCRDLGVAGYETTYGWGMVNAYGSLLTSVSFRVNMKVKMRDRLFCPDSGDVVTVRGTFNDWGNSTNNPDTLRDPDHDSIYVKSINFRAFTGHLYKFWKNPRRDIAWEDSISNRILDVSDIDTILAAPFFNNDSIGGAAAAVIGVALSPGWNMISNPVRVTNDSVRILYPSTVFPYAYSFFPGGYAQDYTMENRTGYWGKFPSAMTQNVTGQRIIRDSITVAAGWNMVGTISGAVDTGTIVSLPAGLRKSLWYGYGPSGYIPATQLVPGKAYWVNSNGAGKFVLATGSAHVRPRERREDPLSTLNSVSITDNSGASQTLYFGVAWKKEAPVTAYVLPPVPPTGGFDARFETPEGGSMVRTHSTQMTDPAEFPIKIQSDAYPLTVTWKMRNGALSYELSDGLGGTVFQAKKMLGEGRIRILMSDVARLVVKLIGDDQIPGRFELSQNYPNPFNPKTTIRFSIPFLGSNHPRGTAGAGLHVTLKVYDVLGQEIATLVNEARGPGTYSVGWSAEGLASGLYLYRLQVGEFTQTRKLTLVK